MGNKITKIREQQFKISTNKFLKNPGTKITKIWEQKLQKIQELKSGNRNYKNSGTQMT
jgi:hypothetical protein